jgi:hypothetical protein
LALLVCFLGSLCGAQIAGTDDPGQRGAKAAALLSAAQGPSSEQQGRIGKTGGGYVKFLSFPSGRGVPVAGADPDRSSSQGN